MADVSRFEGNGLSFKAKLIGVEDVPEARGDQMCQEALLKLKNAVRVSGEHKQKIFVNVTLEGLKIVDAITLAANQNKKKNEQKVSKPADENEDASQDSNGAVLHSHAVHRISFISRDVTDNRAFGYIFGESDNTHKFFAIKTAAAAEQLVYTIRDLFQAVYDMKKKEMEEAKEKLEKGEVTTESVEGNSQTPGNGSTSGNAQTPHSKPNADGENIYQVPPNNAPVKQEPQAEQVANLLDLEDQTEHILKGIEQIKNLEFDSITDDQQSSPVSPIASPLASLSAAAPANPDPWGMAAAPAAPAASSSSSALGDLAGLQTNAFPSMPTGMQQPFSGTPFSMPGAFGAAPGFSTGATGLPVNTDPFGNDPFSANTQPRPAMPAGFPPSNPFGGGGFPPQQLYGAPPHGMMPGAPGPAGFIGAQAFGRAPNPFGVGYPQMQMPVQQGNLFGETKEDANLLQPMKKDDGSGQREEAVDKAAPKKLRDDLFGDLVDIKKTAGSSADSPKDLFAKVNAGEKKSMNAMMAEGPAVPPRPTSGNPTSASQASTVDLFPPEPFGSSDSIEEDKTRGLLTSHSEDPFDTTHICSALSDPASRNFSSHVPNTPLSSSSIPADTPPPVPKRPVIPGKDKSSPASLHHLQVQQEHLQSLSSSSSSSSPSTSPSLSSKSTHSEFSSTKPPPLPKRLASDGSAPLSSCDSISANGHPSDLSLSQIPPDTNAFRLPSPDEPPPPLPVLSYAIAAPPPPPRPNTSSVTVAPQSAGANPTTGDKFESAFPSQRTALPRSVVKPTELTNSDALSSELRKPHKDQSNVTLKVVPRDPTDPFSPPLPSHKSKSKSRTGPSVLPPNTEKQSADPFSVPLSTMDSTKVSTTKSPHWSPEKGKPTVNSEDPFKVPLHLTPGFKMEAKFGNDPFDDSFAEVLQARSSESAWEPFPPDASTGGTSVAGVRGSVGGDMKAPGTDLFGAPLQPVNGNTNETSLFD